MTITLENAGRRFNQEWIFRGLDFVFSSGESYAVLGPNGSGKSTLLSLLMGALSPSEGEVSYVSGSRVEVDQVYKHLSFAAPYLDLIEEFTLRETINFHFRFKGFVAGLDARSVMELLGLSGAKDKALKYFSSGMKQRVKLALACCSDSDLLLLDEPTANLDRQGLRWYHELMAQFSEGRLVVVGSNQEEEYTFCRHSLYITDYKTGK